MTPATSKLIEAFLSGTCADDTPSADGLGLVNGLACSSCGNNDSQVMETRAVQGALRRRRKCLHCGDRSTTYEISAQLFEQNLKREAALKHSLALIRACLEACNL